MHIDKTPDSDTISTYQVSLVQIGTGNKLEVLNKALPRTIFLPVFKRGAPATTATYS